MLALAWLLALSVVAADALFLQWLPISFRGLAMPVACVSVLIAVGVLLRERMRPAAWIANCAALWIVMLISSPILTYIAASFAAPLLYDAEFVRQDLALGFDWRRYYSAIELYPALANVLLAAYSSLIFQGLLAVIYLPLRGRHRQFLEVYSAATIAVVLTAALSALFPAWGPVPYFFAGHRDALVNLQDLSTLRAGTAAVFTVGKLQGLVQFPSFHSASAFLMIWGFRGCGLVSWGMVGLNGVLLASTPGMGNHYLVDLVGGAGVAALSIAAIRAARRLPPYLDAALARIRPLPATRGALPETRS